MNYTQANIGDKVKFVGKNLKHFWFTDIIANAKRELEKDKEYTISEIKIFSSWTGITLKETGNLMYSLGWFEKI